MSDTPETDEYYSRRYLVSKDDAELARKLERERNEARELAEYWRDKWGSGSMTMDGDANLTLPWEDK